MRKCIIVLLFNIILGMPTVSFATEGEVEPPHQEWPHEGMTGTFDRAALQRGFQVYKEVCAACHSMNLLSYRNLADLGYTEDQVKAIASQYEVTDGPNDEGQMFKRPGKPSDRFVSPYANEQEARAANGGALPPDLSLMAKARAHGEDYVYALLTGYETAPPGTDLPQGQYYNKYFPGHLISMPPPLIVEDQVPYADSTKATVQQMSHDVATFLAWAAEPKMEARKQMGIKVLLFLAVFAVMMYFVKRKLWRDVK